jgi:hypothetical protein
MTLVTVDGDVTAANALVETLSLTANIGARINVDGG